MHAEAAYWALLTEPCPTAGTPGAADTCPADLLAGWLAAGNQSVRDLFAMHPDALAAALGRSAEDLAPLLALRARLPRAERLLAGLERAGVDLLTPWDRRYPRALRAAITGQHAPSSSGRHAHAGLSGHCGHSGSAGVPPGAPRSDGGDISPGTPGGRDARAPRLAAPTVPVLWIAGNLDLLAKRPVALLGTRDAPPEAIAFTRAVAAGVAGRGRPILGGVSRAIERAALEAALAAPDGASIAVLGQGIARALPDLQRWQREIRAGRLLLISAWHPEAIWQPGIEVERAVLLAALAERVVLAQIGQHDSTWQVGWLILDRQRPLLVRAAEQEAARTLLAGGALPVAWPVDNADALADEILAATRQRARPPQETPAEPAADNGDNGDAGPASGEQETPPAQPRRRSGAARTRAAIQEPAPRQPADADPAGLPATASEALPDAVLRVLRRRRGAVGKGALLQAVAAPEVELDRALATLIAEGRVLQRAHRTGVGYAAVRAGDAAQPDGGFQLSLFSQET